MNFQKLFGPLKPREDRSLDGIIGDDHQKLRECGFEGSLPRTYLETLSRFHTRPYQLRFPNLI